MKVVDKLFNRIIDGNIKELSESDVNLLQESVLAKGAKIWEVSDYDEVPDLLTQGLKMADFINIDGGLFLVNYIDDTHIFLVQTIEDGVYQEIYTKSDNEWSYRELYFAFSDWSEYAQKAETPHIWELENMYDTTEYVSSMKAGDIILEKDNPSSWIITYIGFSDNVLEDLEMFGFMSGGSSLPYRAELDNGTIVTSGLQVGTKLYKHDIIFDGNDDIYVTLISTISNFSSNISTMFNDIYNACLNGQIISIPMLYNVNGMDEIIYNATIVGAREFCGFTQGSGIMNEQFQSVTTFVDTVTPL